MSGNSIMSGWYHSIVATIKDKAISITIREFNHEMAGILHNFFRGILG